MIWNRFICRAAHSSLFSWAAHNVVVVIPIVSSDWKMIPIDCRELNWILIVIGFLLISIAFNSKRTEPSPPRRVEFQWSNSHMLRFLCWFELNGWENWSCSLNVYIFMMEKFWKLCGRYDSELIEWLCWELWRKLTKPERSWRIYVQIPWTFYNHKLLVIRDVHRELFVEEVYSNS